MNALLENLARLVNSCRLGLQYGLETVAGIFAKGHRSSALSGRIVSLATLALLSASIFFASYPLRNALGVFEEFKTNLARSEQLRHTPLVLDREGMFVVAPASFEDDGWNALDDAFGRSKTRDGARWNTSFVAEVPSAFTKCLENREDGNNEEFYHFAGLDWFNVAAIPYRRFWKGDQVGASTLYSQYEQQFAWDADEEIGHASRYVIKAAEIWHRTPATYYYLGDETKYEQAIASAFDHFSGARGIAQASWLKFGKDPAELSDAEAILLASTTKKPVCWRYSKPVKGADYERRRLCGRTNQKTGEFRDYWKLAAGRAVKCANQIALENEGQREQLITEVEALVAEERHNPQVFTPEAVSEALALTTQRDRVNRLGRMQRASDYGSPYLQHSYVGARIELRQALGFQWGHALSRLYLTQSYRDYLDFCLGFHEQLNAWAQRQRARGELNTRYADWATETSPLEACTTSSPSAEAPRFTLAVADENGRIVRYYSTRATQSYMGHGRDPKEQRYYNWEHDREQLASIAKIGAAWLFADDRADAASQGYYRDLIARSRSKIVTAELGNLSTQWGPQEFSDEADRTARGLHWSRASSSLQFSQEPVSGASIPAAWSQNFSMGSVSASPRTVHHGVAALLAAVTGRSAPKPPTLIDKACVLDLENRTSEAAISRVPDYTTLMANPVGERRMGEDDKGKVIWQRRPIEPEAIERAANLSGGEIDLFHSDLARAERTYAMLNAAVCQPRGTLSQLSNWCSPTRTSRIFAKTGTLDRTYSYNNSDPRPPRQLDDVIGSIWAAGGVEMSSGRGFSFVVLMSESYFDVGGKSIATPLAYSTDSGNKLFASDLAPLLDWTLQDLENNPPPLENDGAQICR